MCLVHDVIKCTLYEFEDEVITKLQSRLKYRLAQVAMLKIRADIYRCSAAGAIKV